MEIEYPRFILTLLHFLHVARLDVRLLLSGAVAIAVIFASFILMCVLCGAVVVACFIIFFMLALYIYTWGTMGMCKNMVSMQGKIAIVTGGTSGIGLETARDFARRGARVIICSRGGGAAAVEDIKKTTGTKLVKFMEMDLNSDKSVKAFVWKIQQQNSKIDILLNNAGIFQPKGKEDLYQINYLGHFLLTNQLKWNLARGAMVINVSSCLNVFKCVYCSTKLNTILFTKELSRRWQSLGITTYSLHPGFVRTKIFNKSTMENLIICLAYMFGKSPIQGAQTSIYLSTEPGIENRSGQHFADCRSNWWTRFWTSSQADDSEQARRLWDESLKVLQPKLTLMS